MCIQNITAIVSCFIAAVGVFVAYIQLRGLKKQITLAVNNQTRESLKIVLEIETQLNARKLEFDKANKSFLESKDDNERESISVFIDTTKESYFNALDRLCFCIQKGYVDENEYRPEYRDMIKDTVKQYE